MAEFEEINLAEINPDKPVVGLGGFAEKVKNSLDFLNGSLSSTVAAGLTNGSFEVTSDEANPDVPDSWVKALYAGGSGGQDLVSPQHGLACVKFVHPGGVGNGGGSLTSNYVACGPQIPEIISLIHWASVAGMHNQIQIAYYDASKLFVSTATIYDSVANPTTPTQLLLGFTPPATARFYKVILIGGQTDVNVAGSAYFDGLTRQPLTVLQGLTSTSADLSNSETDFTDAGTITLTFATSHNLPTTLLMFATVTGDDDVELGNTTGTARLRLGAAYSNEVSKAGLAGGQDLFILHAAGGTFETAHGAKTLTINVQLKTGTAAHSAGFAIDANAAKGYYA